jgi:Lectin C-type domain
MSRAILPAVLPLLATLSLAQQTPEYHTGPFGPGGTWNVYQTIKTEMTWDKAREHAETLIYKAGDKELKGHLVTIGSAAENAFVRGVAEETEIWLGLTDNEKHGAAEAFGSRTKGWRWVTGEELTWEYWSQGEPNEANIEGKGEDAAILGDNGMWNDSPSGTDGQADWKRRFVVEWETGMAAPPEGMVRLMPLLPKQWKVDFAAPSAKGSGPWAGWVAGLDTATGQRLPMKGASLADVLDGLVEETGGAPAVRFSALQFHWPDSSPRVEWAGEPVTFPHMVHQKPWGGLYTATLRVAEEQVWSFLVCCDDFAAVRIPGVKWTAAHGDGFIDPLDPECLSRMLTSTASRFIGTVRLPAGDHRLEVVFGNSSQRSQVSVLAAQGEYTRPGDTDKWRVPGYKTKGPLAWPGISEAAWTVKRTAGEAPGKKNRAYGLREASADAETAANPVTLPEINFIDEAAPGVQSFPGAAPLPGDMEGQQEYQIVSGDATLVIPEDGKWQIGFCSDIHGALIVEGIKWTGLSAVIKDGSIRGEAIVSGKSSSHLAGQAELKKGEYKIHFLYVEDIGPMSFSIFGAPAGYPPRLLRKGGAGSEPDVDGIPLVTP